MYLETRIEAAMSLEGKIENSKEEVKHVQDVMLRTKTDLSQQIADMRLENSKQ